MSESAENKSFWEHLDDLRGSLIKIVVAIVLRVLIVFAVHAVLEGTHPFSKTLHQLGNLLATEQQQHDKGDNNDFCHSDSHNFDFLAIGCWLFCCQITIAFCLKK